MGRPPAIGPRPRTVPLAVSLRHSEKGIGSRYRGLRVECTTSKVGVASVVAETSSSSVDRGDILVVLPTFSISSHLKLFKSI